MLQGSSWTSQYDSLELSSVPAEDVSGVQPEFGLIDDQVIEVPAAQVKTRTVQPCKISTIWLDKLEFRDVLGQKFTEKVQIAPEVTSALFQPWASRGIGSLTGHQAQRIELRVTTSVHLFEKARANLRIRDPDVGDLKPC